MTDWELLEQYHARHYQSALTMLVDRHVRMVYGTCYRHLGHQSQANEATCLVFFLLDFSAAKIKRKKNSRSVASWLFDTSCLVSELIAHEQWTAAERKRLSARGRGGHDGDEFRQSLRRNHVLDESLRALRPMERDILLQRYCGGDGIDEIAEHMGLTSDQTTRMAMSALHHLSNGVIRRSMKVSEEQLTDGLAGASSGLSTGLPSMVVARVMNPASASAQGSPLARGFVGMAKVTLRRMLWNRVRFGVITAVTAAVIVLLYLVVSTLAPGGVTPRIPKPAVHGATRHNS